MLAAVLVFSFSSVSSASVDSVYEAALINIKGDVQVDTKADGRWIAPVVGMKLMKGAIIKTGANSSAEIVFDAEGLNVLLIKPNSQLVVDKSLVKLANGSVMAKFANLKKGSTFVVKTPTAACAIRGSGMGVDYINNMTVAKAYEDKVYVTGLDSKGNPVSQEVIIPEGWKTQIEKGGKTDAPVELSENEKKIFDAWVAAVTGDQGTGAGDTDGEKEKEEIDTKDLDDVKEVSPSQ